ncbi:hypothetical protein OPT61_g9616 [Boeremia exigua]|uniref:Uncharacterized protein n=1 Tax=Boeremia exigua TaxID=749465 RepID=A0ACC2HTM0_9PLEO|nr:hypothetical protein OPT61_g9616 [Boeremia exigua]
MLAGAMQRGDLRHAAPLIGTRNGVLEGAVLGVRHVQARQLQTAAVRQLDTRWCAAGAADGSGEWAAYVGAYGIRFKTRCVSMHAAIVHGHTEDSHARAASKARGGDTRVGRGADMLRRRAEEGGDFQKVPAVEAMTRACGGVAARRAWRARLSGEACPAATGGPATGTPAQARQLRHASSGTPAQASCPPAAAVAACGVVRDGYRGGSVWWLQVSACRLSRRVATHMRLQSEVLLLSQVSALCSSASRSQYYGWNRYSTLFRSALQFSAVQHRVVGLSRVCSELVEHCASSSTPRRRALAQCRAHALTSKEEEEKERQAKRKTDLKTLPQQQLPVAAGELARWKEREGEGGGVPLSGRNGGGV